MGDGALRRRLLALAQRIADNEPVDWDEVEKTSPRGEEPTPGVRSLREIHRISQEHLRLVGESSSETSWGPLDLGRRIGRGGFGDVYLAHDRNLDRTVALKWLHEDDDPVACRRFVDEARKLARVDHENVVTIHGVDRHDGRLGLWMEYVDGETLENWTRNHGPMNAEEAARIGGALCRALAAIHAAGIVHGDVKLSNVVRERGGRIVLMDFGSSSRRSASSSARYSGTPAYLAPEVVRRLPSDERVDVYALGVLLYRLVSGAFPAEPEDPERPEVDRTPVPLLDRNPRLPRWFVRAVERAIHPDPEQRFRSAGEFERALAVDRAGTHPASPPASRSTWGRRRGLAVLSIAAILVVGALAVTMRTRPGALEARAGFLRLTDEGTEERLRDGVPIRPGDRLFLDFEATDPVWVYVVNADGRGEEYLLFPVPGLDRTNPLPAGRHRLPGSVGGQERFWNVTSAGGRESLLVVAAREPVEFLDEKITGLRPVAPGVPIPLVETSVTERMRGIGGLESAPRLDGTAPSPFREIGRRVRLQEGVGRDVRSWSLTLVNPE